MGELHFNFCQGKGEAFDRGNYRGLMLTDQVMKLVERTLDFYIRDDGKHRRDAVWPCAW